MSLVFTMILVAVLSCTPAMSQGRVEGRGATRRFISEKYKFTMSVPAGWSISPGLDVPVFFYAPPSGRFVQATIPRGGGVIAVQSHDSVSGQAKLAASPEKWASADALASGSALPRIEPFHFPSQSGVSRAVVSSYNQAAYSPDEETQHVTAIFWECEHELFAAHFNYNAEDPIGPTLEKVFLRTIRSFRPLEKGSP
jgi:hypothetical protein